ncbi:NUDIX hydrolase [Scatolibacter rhodanostii]|uniref:NUDIX hydrolase n=1 Tax=Scatolibacter rhodanostii TaxID=2014781 RepID=UPI000C083D76|nr:NUDIX domain-containing protein [Scatolibacter rhodanostii]
MNLTFYDLAQIDDSLLKYAVIAAQYKSQWVFCKNKTRKWEIPGGHREKDESIFETAKRELFEETGAKEFEIKPICIYKINNFGMLFYADITAFGSLPPFEIEKIDFFDDIPDELSFPLIHPKHLEYVKAKLSL